LRLDAAVGGGAGFSAAGLVTKRGLLKATALAAGWYYVSQHSNWSGWGSHWWGRGSGDDQPNEHRKNRRKSNWDRHSGTRSGGKERKDDHMKYSPRGRKRKPPKEDR